MNLISPINLKMPESSGLAKLNLTLKTLDGEVLHKNFMHFEINSNEKLKDFDLFSFEPDSFFKFKLVKKILGSI